MTASFLCSITDLVCPSFLGAMPALDHSCEQSEEKVSCYSSFTAWQCLFLTAPQHADPQGSQSSHMVTWCQSHSPVTSQSIIEGNQGRNWRHEIKQEPRQNAGFLLLLSHTTEPTADWTLPHHSLITKMPSQKYLDVCLPNPSRCLSVIPNRWWKLALGCF